MVRASHRHLNGRFQVVKSWQCPIDGRTLLQSEASESHVAWCPRCHGLWLRGPAAAAVQEALRGSKWVHPVPSYLFDAHRCPVDMAPLLALAGHASKLEACEACGGLWLSGGLLRDFRSRHSAASIPGVGPWSSGHIRTERVEPLSDLVELLGPAAEAVGLSASDIAQALFELFGST